MPVTYAARVPVRRSSQAFLCPVLHAERLHDDRVWHAVRALLEVVERRGGHMTLFVSPFWAMVENRPLRDRLAEVAERGHEVGQHTHYYDWHGAPAGAYRKKTDLADHNVCRRLDEDFDYLVSGGFRPRGFVSGAWETPPVLAGWLGTHGFTYDCTGRAFAAAAAPNAAPPGGDGIVQIPTTHSLRTAVTDLADGRLARHRVESASYSLYYAHDYDLLRPGRNRAMQLVARLARGGAAVVPVDHVARAAAGG